jgi:hypothetical protein
MIELRLYCTGGSKKMTDYAQCLIEYFESKSIEISISVIHVLDDPAKALHDEIIAIPTLIKVSPEPQKRVFGDIWDLGLVSRALNLEV